MTREKNALLQEIRAYSFAVTETVLFLDTHPCDRDAIDAYNKYNAMLEDVYTEYESRFGPLSMYGGTDCDRWSWVDGPWPWECEANLVG